MNRVTLTGRIIDISGLLDKHKGKYALAHMEMKNSLPLTLVFRGQTAYRGVTRIKEKDKILIDGEILKAKESKQVYILVLRFEMMDFLLMRGEEEMNIDV